MDYSKITCKETNRDIKADTIYKIRNNDCIENIVSVCYACPYSDSKRPECKNCYGAISQNVVRKINQETKRVKMDVTNKRNTFSREDNEITKYMAVDEFMNEIEIIANLNTANWNHGQRVDDHLRCYDRGRSYKTDCVDCIRRCKQNNELTACQKAKKYIESMNVNLSSASEQQIANIELPEDCICKEQTQTCFYI